MTTTFQSCKQATETFLVSLDPRGYSDAQDLIEFWGPNAWTFTPLAVSGMWEYILGEDWAYFWEDAAATEEFYKRIVDTANQAHAVWPDQIYMAMVEVDYEFEEGSPRKLPWGHAFWGDREMIQRQSVVLGDTGMIARGFVRTVMMAPLSAEELSWRSERVTISSRANQDSH